MDIPPHAAQGRPSLATVVGLTAVYYVAGKLGLSLAVINASASAVWPATGIALAALLVWGSRVGLSVFLGAFLVNFTTAGTPLTSLGIAVGNTIEGLVGAGLVRRFTGGRDVFGRPRDVFGFAAAGVLATALSASCGVGTLALGGLVSPSDSGAIWLTWWLGDLGGALVVGPLLLLWMASPRPRLDPARTLEAALLGLTLSVVGLLVFGGFLHDPTRGLSFLSLLPLLWAALRFNQRASATATALLWGVAVWGCVQGAGPAAGINESLVLSQAFLGVSSVTALSVAATVRQRRRAEEALLTAAAERERAIEGLKRLEKAVETLPVGVTIADVDGTILYTNPAEAGMHGYRPEELIGRNVGVFMPPGWPPAGDRPPEIRTWKRETINRRRDGTLFPVQLLSDAVKGAAGQTLAVVTCTEEIGERKRAEQALRSSEERYRLLFERNLAGVYRAAPSGRLLECNEAFARLLGYGSAGELLGRGLGELSVARGEQEALTARLRQKGGLTNVERRLRRKDGGSVWVLENATLLTGSDGERVVQGTLIDITDRKEFEERIEFQAYHDVLTGLPNRAALEERLPHLVEQARRAGRGLAVLFLDLDRFKDVNDAHGHSFGDRLLQQVARRLRECVREDDLVSRVGGDEFVVALHRGRRGSARRVAGKVLARLAEPILLEGHELCVTASIGISLFPEDGEDGGALLRSADAAMYRAKESGRNALELAAGGGAVAPATGPRTRPPR